MHRVAPWQDVVPISSGSSHEVMHCFGVPIPLLCFTAKLQYLAFPLPGPSTLDEAVCLIMC